VAVASGAHGPHRIAPDRRCTVATSNVSEFVTPIKVSEFSSLRYAEFAGVSCYALRTGEDTAILYSTSYQPVCFIDADVMPHLTLLGDAALADTQALLDTMDGGAVAIACNRQMEVA
jgi:hypothetical protein